MGSTDASWVETVNGSAIYDVTYKRYGMYQFGAMVTDNHGLTGSATYTVEVRIRKCITYCLI